ncbi:probable LRR receptor-like serine/threonine-protein kinase At1g63430 isoform X1 [Typha latifolia]|uniref:probable LRR receptor-like serine/threonine-protein kinase At1g63430 isoform X1 n=1 Tax=Typha latifolia TaxID=4733 RepID=UPI003C2B496A
MKRSLGFPLLLIVAVKWGAFFVSSSSLLEYQAVLVLAAFKQAIFEDPHAVLSDWNSRDKDPCSWYGVICSASRDSVFSLSLSNSSLKGFLAPELGQLGSLKELYLNKNLLLGTIPKQIGMLKNLTVLNLSMNRLTGPIPPELGDLGSITKIDLHSNALSGNIPSQLGKLEKLVELRLDRNRLRGRIPGRSNTSFSPSGSGLIATNSSGNGLCQSPRLRVGDFSYNFFVGKVPPCLKYLPRSSFQGNCFQDEYSILQRSSQICNGESPKSQQVGKETHKRFNEWHKHQILQQPAWLLILEITTGVLVIIFIITGTVTAAKSCKLKPYVRIPWKRTMNWRKEIAVSIDNEILKNVSRFNRQDLEVACEDFSNIIGSTPDSVIYKGIMKNGPEIAVISLCIPADCWTSYLEFFFRKKIADLARLSHDNVADLLGYCEESEPFSRMLVFEYASNGTLYEHLHYGEESQLSWHRRMKIAIGIAQGLRYLHTELQPPFAIAEFNSNSVYITEDFTPKLVDFESWKMIFSKSEKNYGYINDGAIHDYMDSLEQRHMDVQSNTLAFGVVLLEIISGRPPYCKDRGSLLDWAAEHLQHPEEIGKLVDPELETVKADDLAVICSVVSLCIEPDPSKRPSMQIITAVLENGIDLSAAALLKESPLAWAELALSS